MNEIDAYILLETLFDSPVALLDRHPVTYLKAIWNRSFADVPRVNTVEIAYVKSWVRRLGSIRVSADGTVTRIALNGLLSRREVPVCVLVATIAHELAHYAHGFGSPLPRRYRYPHANGVVARELEKRGFGEIHQQCQAWLDQEWYPFLELQKLNGCSAAAFPIDMSVPPTRSQCLVLSVALQKGQWYHPTPVPLTEQEALWLRDYISDGFSQRLLIQLVHSAEASLEDEQRTFALKLSYQHLEPVTIASFADWNRMQRWAAVPAHFEPETALLSHEQQADEWKRVQQLRALIFAAARGGRTDA